MNENRTYKIISNLKRSGQQNKLDNDNDYGISSHAPR